MSINKGVRFRILARDKFTCQFCGRQAPTVSLEVDHLTPRSRGGTDAGHNLITACFDCNRGKRAIQLTQEFIQRFTPKPLEPVIQKVIARFIPKKCAYQKRSRRLAPERIPVSDSFVYTGPDEFLPKFQCSYCGFINTYEGDGCNCKKRREQEANPELETCTNCLEELEEGEEEYCHRCYCYECMDEKVVIGLPCITCESEQFMEELRAGYGEDDEDYQHYKEWVDELRAN